MIGLLAGGGNLPLIFAKNAKKSGEQVITVAIKGEAKSSLNRWSDQIYWYNIGDLGKAIKAFKKHGVRRISIVGKVRKIRLFSINWILRFQYWNELAVSNCQPIH